MEPPPHSFRRFSFGSWPALIPSVEVHSERDEVAALGANSDGLMGSGHGEGSTGHSRHPMHLGALTSARPIHLSTQWAHR